ncbi:hypothetical protein SAMN04488065_2789 [Haloplanus vescus]|uniref:DUF7847 domain-containing protein n=1 Tax=Haloplanus vescus TaxID=555874 RepID=A0A1H4AIA9_9EURY|nr:hypothetical protein [Haloplanus vescus]SEA35471.1 hypothetical protein SAMN04488065_2789 [Haloplanus vescus]
MSLQIGAALKQGGYRFASRTGALFTVVYAALYVVYQVGYNAFLNALYARWGLEATLPTPVSLPTPLAGVVVLVCLLGLSTMSIVATRTFVAGERDAVPREYYTEGLAWTVPNLFVGGLVTMVLVSVGFVLLLVPGIFLTVSFAFLPMYIAVENDNFVTAMRRSWALSRGDRLPILGVLVVVFAVAFAVGIVFGVANVVLSLAGYGVVMPVLAAACFTPVTLFNLAVMSVAFEQLRDGVSPMAR